MLFHEPCLEDRARSFRLSDRSLDPGIIIFDVEETYIVRTTVLVMKDASEKAKTPRSALLSGHECKAIYNFLLPLMATLNSLRCKMLLYDTGRGPLQ
jgi:hypothetical protein